MTIERENLKLKQDLFKIWERINPNIREKFNNLNGKTGRYQVPIKLFQDRTSRKNRVLLPWKILYNNKLEIEQLKTFYGGLCIEFVNDDFFNTKYLTNPVYKILKNKIGSNDYISSIISFRTEDGDPGATVPRDSYKTFEKFRENGTIKIDVSPIKRDPNVTFSGKGDNSVWKGNIFISIKGGDQNSIESHTKLPKQQLFNPATDYANEQVCLDMDITMSFFAMHCYNIEKKVLNDFDLLYDKAATYLKKRNYDGGNLYNYCINHPSLKYGNGNLIDSIQYKKISINDFQHSGNENSSVISHNEAANKDKFYYDKINKCILSPARPMNLFWSTHWSNMMQQNYTLEEFCTKEDEWVYRRKND